jgi:hypothetical protein
MAKRKPQWTRRTLKLKEDHGWHAKPGYKIFVADRGSVRFDFPESWIFVPGENGSVKFHDRQPPDDECTLQMTVFYLPDDVDWSGLPLETMLREVTKGGDGVLSRSEPANARRPNGLEISWLETRYLDPETRREARTRTGMARWSNIQVLLTFAFWESDTVPMKTAWDEIFRTLVLGDYIEDPTQRLID